MRSGQSLAWRGVRHTKIGAEIEEIVLNAEQHRVDPGANHVGHGGDAGKPNRRIGLVDRAIGFDPEIVLGTALAGAKRGRAVIARPRVNSVQYNHGAPHQCLEPVSKAHTEPKPSS